MFLLVVSFVLLADAPSGNPFRSDTDCTRRGDACTKRIIVPTALDCSNTISHEIPGVELLWPFLLSMRLYTTAGVDLLNGGLTLYTGEHHKRPLGVRQPLPCRFILIIFVKRSP